MFFLQVKRLSLVELNCLADTDDGGEWVRRAWIKGDRVPMGLIHKWLHVEATRGEKKRRSAGQV